MLDEAAVCQRSLISSVVSITCTLSACVAPTLAYAQTRLVTLHFARAMHLEGIWVYQKQLGVGAVEPGPVFCVGANVNDPEGGRRLAVARASLFSASGLRTLLGSKIEDDDPRILLETTAPQRDAAFTRMDLNGDGNDEVLLTGHGGAGGTSLLTVFRVSDDKVDVVFSDSSRFGFDLIDETGEGQFEIANPGFEWTAGSDDMLRPKQFKVYGWQNDRFVVSSTQTAQDFAERVAPLVKASAAANLSAPAILRIHVRKPADGNQQSKAGSNSEREFADTLQRLSSENDEVKWRALQSFRSPVAGPQSTVIWKMLRVFRYQNGSVLVTVTWDSPRASNLLLFSRNGKVISDIQLGRIECIRQIDMDGDGVSELLVKTFGAGTGVAVHTLFLFRINGDDGLQQVWSEVVESTESDGISSRRTTSNVSIELRIEPQQALIKVEKKVDVIEPRSERSSETTTRTYSYEDLVRKLSEVGMVVPAAGRNTAVGLLAD